MIKRIVCVHASIALLMLTGTNQVSAQCNDGSCAPAAAGCPTGHCGVGGGGLLGRFLSHGGGDCYGGQAGPCLTCDNVWDGYCESKPHCLPEIRLPHPKACFAGLGLGMGCGCNSCAGGVGLYGRSLCPPRHRGHLLSKLFHRSSDCDQLACDGVVTAPACDAGCDQSVPAPAATPVPPAAPMEDVLDDAVPPAPPVADHTTASRASSFDWLQRALQLN